MARNGIRSRSGCFTCRQRKKKCNEEKPICSGCKRNCLQCYWPAADPVRGGVKKTTKEKAGVVRRSLHPSRNGDEDLAAEEAAASAESLSASRRHTTQASSDDIQHQAVTASVARSDSISSAGRDHYSPQSPGGPFHMFMLPDIASLQAELLPEAQASLPVTISREWEEDDGNVFELENGHGHITAGDLEAASSYPSISRSSFGQQGSTPSPTQPIDSGMLLAEQDDPETIAGDMDARSSEIIHNSIITDSDSNVDALAAPGSFQAMGEEELVLEAPEHEEEPTADTDTSMSIAMPGRMSLLPQQDPDAFHILSFYLSRTANCMGNGSTDSNPFLSTLIPLAFSDQLVLQLLLAQGAAHRQVGQAQTNGDQIAQRYYTGSLRLFRSAIREYISGKSTDKLVLATGSLILSLTEVARGDIEGNIFDHIIAAKSLLVELSVEKRSSVPEDFMDFLIEYYTHMSVLSMMSVKPRLSANPLLDPTIETLAKKLIEKRYIGQLVGCWLELLLAIPHTFELGQRMRTSDRPSPDDMVMFGLLQAQITAFEPDTRASKETRLAGLVFKQACLLYLWSILGCPQEGDAGGNHSKLMKTAIAEGIALLEQIPPTSRVNTSLCWPLTIIGCCTTEKSLQSILRTRLQSMFSIIGLGNMGETLLLIELVWKFPLDQRSPWVLCELMQEQQRWISFA